MAFMWVSENNLRKAVVSFYYLGSETEFRLSDTVARTSAHEATSLDLLVNFRKRIQNSRNTIS